MENLLVCKLGDMTVRYRIERKTGRVELNLFPADFPLKSISEADPELSPLASFKLAEDDSCSGFGCGGTMRYSSTMDKLSFVQQKKEENAVVTEFSTPAGVELTHRLFWKENVPVLFAEVTLTNKSSAPVSVEFLESFAIGGIGEELSADDFSELLCHRFRSRWCDEARHEEWPIWQKQLERYPKGYVIRNDRFGQTGTLPIRNFHSFAAIEDRKNKMLLGAYLCWNASWQMELSMRNAPGLTFSGGLADREFGAWVRHLAPGERLTAPRAMLSCVHGDLDDLTSRMVKGIESNLDVPESEEDLPVLYNEWPTTWGKPSHENMVKIAEKIKSLPVKYLVMDAGWFLKDGNTSWAKGQGDWIPNSTYFPQGLSATANMIRSYGLIPGIWFEAEVAGSDSDAFEQDRSHFVHRDGKVITVGGMRRFWNFADPETDKILDQRIIRLLKDNGFGYVKIDYNDNIGLGCDHPDSQGEGIRQQGLGAYRFFRAMRKAIPDLIIENCASGGHRLEPGMLELSSMSSFSDAQEDTIPLIAASLHRLMPPRQMQIWAVIRSNASLTNNAYLLSTAMMGRICLSGDIFTLSEEQMQLIREALEFYRKIVPVIKNGNSRLQYLSDPRRSVLKGGQVLSRIADAGNEAAVYFHAFHEKPQRLEAVLPDSNWEVSDVFPKTERNAVSISGNKLCWTPQEEMSGCAVYLTHKNDRES